MPHHQTALLRRSSCTQLAGWLVAISFLSVRTAIAEQPDTKPVPPLRGEFPVGSQGRFLVLPVNLGGNTIDCLLDTGAAISCFDIGLRQHFGPERGSRALKTPGGELRGPTFGWPRVQLREQTLTTNEAIIGINLKEIRAATNSNIQGILGIDVLRTSRMQIDFDRGRLRFLERLPSQFESLGVELKLLDLENGPPFAEATVGADFSIRLLIDTGTQGQSLAPGLFDQLLDQREVRRSSTFSSITAAGLNHGARGYLKELQIAGFQKQHLQVDRTEFTAIGLRFLSRFQITFDFPGESLYLKPGKNFDRPEPAASSGLTLVWENGLPVVIRVRADSPAANAGVKKQDVLLAINGSRELVRDPFALRQLLTTTPGEMIRLLIRRAGEELQLQISLAED